MTPNNPAPITDAELAELDRLRAAAPAGTWTAGKNKASGRVQVHNGQHQVCAVWHTTAHPASETAEAIAALHNAYPALRARLDTAEFQLTIQTASASMRGRSLLETLKQFQEFQKRLEAAERELQGWRHERAMTLTAFAHIRDGGDPALIGHPGGSVFGDALRDMLQKRLDAAERERLEYQEATQGRLELVRQLDVRMNGEEGAARQAALCDIVAQFPAWLADRDARMKREGAAEWLENAAREGGYYERSSEGMLEEAKQLREEK